ncbi:hypothetical protein GUJ93_ZPchr0008g13054 [Zizania palustris]|uniref:Protein kinase domain-containing protein n=1 Tax=Zizania palustris TaxID=103762 RepID=A0A8J5RJL5_ZIZPA|nr:hypothetical protein GUJ93_ZPchr0008g13054 [Zizania palustris]
MAKAIPGLFHRSTALQLISVLCVLGVVVPDAGGAATDGKAACPPFTCGHLNNVSSSPFRRRGDPSECGVPSHELTCVDGQAIIHIDGATYFVMSINYTGYKYYDGYFGHFWVVDTNILDSRNNCSLPRWKRVPHYKNNSLQSLHNIRVEFDPVSVDWWSVFVSCSQEVKNNDNMYMPVACLSTINSFVYVLTSRDPNYIKNLEPSCGYLAMTPLGALDSVEPGNTSLSLNLSYADVVKFMTKGFGVRFPFSYRETESFKFKECMTDFIQESFIPIPMDKLSWFNTIISLDGDIVVCASAQIPSLSNYLRIIMILMLQILPAWNGIALTCRFVLAPLTVLVFLAQKYWKTRITIDAVEKFLRMQQMLGPTRFAYTDITAITCHFRDKLGQGGYGSVFKGTLFLGDNHVAVKMLDGNSKCDGEDFISEVATIGRIHHVNVVRLVGFCSEEMRKALVYEYMPKGSLDKYIFSSERSFSWDKLNEIAIGIARGINYLHQGCDMQILHFDIKPHNILLDDNFVPKVADFGLAKLYPKGKSFVSDRALRGTIGYIAPEMVSRSFGVISAKSDVYSFGMLLLEMAGGRRNADPDVSQAYYPSWVYDRLIINYDQQIEASEISSSTSSAVDMHELERKLCLVGLWCIQMKSHDRPTMSETIEMLEGDANALQVPPRPFFCDEKGLLPVIDSYFHLSEMTVISEEDEEITELESV